MSDLIRNADATDETPPAYATEPVAGGSPCRRETQALRVTCACPGCGVAVRERWAIYGLCNRCLAAGCVPGQRARCKKGA